MARTVRVVRVSLPKARSRVEEAFAVAASGTVAQTLSARGTLYGDFTDNARISQEIKALLWASPKWPLLDPVKREALEMIAQKIARVLNGDPEHKDNWHDIAGYAKLAEDRTRPLAS